MRTPCAAVPCHTLVSSVLGAPYYSDEKPPCLLTNGAALEVFRAMCVHQGVEPSTAKTLISTPEKVLGSSAHQTTILAEQSGYVSSHDAMAMAHLARNHGAGRFELDDHINPHVGFVIEATKGTKIAKNSRLFTFHHNRPLEESELVSLKAICTVGESEPEQAHRLLEVIDFASTKA